MKRFFVLFTTLLICVSLFGCSKATTGDPTDEYKKQTDVEIKEIDNPGDAETKKIEITGDFSISTETEGAKYSYENGIATITSEGDFILTGKLGGGRVVVNAPDCSVTLTLNETSITNSDNAPISVISAKKVTIYVNDDTYNEINDERSKKTTTDDTEESTDNAAIWADCDLKIDGTGALVVNASYNHGIQSKDKLTVSRVNLKVNSINHSLKGNDSVSINSGEIVLKSETGDGIKTSNSTVSEKGNQKGDVTITGGNILVESYGDGIDASYDVKISSEAVITVKTGKYAGFSTGTSSSKSSSSFGGGFWGFGGMDSGNSSKTSYSTKGIKASNEVVIDGGNIQISSNDDGIHAKKETLESGATGTGNITINGGEMQITASDDGIHGENIVTINGGTVVIKESYEGIEGHEIVINDGYVNAYASDDGMNAFGGSSTGGFSGGGNRPGGNRPGGNKGGSQSGTSAEGTPCITVNGGCVIVETPSGDTDAIDSNGNFIQTGGFLLVKGGSSSGNVAGSIDVDGSISITGGTCIALGGICELPTSGSCNYVRIQRKTFSSGSYSISDGNGTIIAEFTLESTFQSAWICSNAFVKGDSYTITINGNSFVSWKQSGSSATAN